MKHISVYKTSLIWELDIVRDALTQAKVPFFVRSEALGGLRTAFEAWPTPGFGKRWLILVPEEIRDDAKSLIATLHVTHNSDRKPFPMMGPDGVRKALWLSAIFVTLFIVFALWSIHIRH